MSYQAWKRVFEHPENYSPKSSGEYLVLLAIAYFADEQGCNAFPSVSVLSERTCLHERMVQLHLRSLQARGVISSERVDGRRTNCYSIHSSTEKTPEEPSGSEAIGAIDYTPEVDCTPAIDITPWVQPITPMGATHYTPMGDADYTPGVQSITPPSEQVINYKDELLINKEDEPRKAPLEGAIPTIRALLSEVTPKTRYDVFADFWNALLKVYPKEGRVDLRQAKEIARAIDPALWEEVVDGAANYSMSDRVLKHRRIRNLANFLDGEAWVPYKDGPILDPAPTDARTQQSTGVLDFVGRARQHRAQFEQDRGLRN